MFAYLAWNQTGGNRVVTFHEPLVIQAAQNSPASIINQDIHWLSEAVSETVAKPLATIDLNDVLPVRQLEQQKTHVVEISGLTIQKTPELIHLERDFQKRMSASASSNELSGLNESQKIRWDRVKDSIPESTVTTAAIASNSPQLVSVPDGYKLVKGHIEIRGGLAVTNEHHLEVRRAFDGVWKELGQIDLQTAQYQIAVQDLQGQLVARVVGLDGKIYGEGNLRLAQLIVPQVGFFQGPSMQVNPVQSPRGTSRSLYGASGEKNSGKSASYLKGASEKNFASGVSEFSFDDLEKGSSTQVIAEAKDHWPTSTLGVVGANPSLPLIPEKMIENIRQIMADQDSNAPEEIKNLVWGQVKENDQGVAGVEVFVDGQEDVQAVYLNDFMMPDLELKATSSSGLFIFVNLNEGWQGLRVNRGEQLLAVANTIVENNLVANVEIPFSSKSHTASLKIFDAFTGSPISTQVELQSLPNLLEVIDGEAQVDLPQVSNMATAKTLGDRVYAHGNYYYDENTDSVHLPMVRWDWLSELRQSRKLESIPSAGTVVGFGLNEYFEVTLAGDYQLDPQRVFYFTPSGEISERGVPGGGFVILDVPGGIEEVVVMSMQSTKNHSQIMSIDPGSLHYMQIRDL